MAWLNTRFCFAGWVGIISQWRDGYEVVPMKMALSLSEINTQVHSTLLKIPFTLI